MAFVNKTIDTSLDKLQEIQEFYQQEATYPTEKNNKRIPTSRDLTNQPQQVTVNQVATKKPRQKKIMCDVSNFK